jgi:RNA polymerase sigma-70 factor, ECF subfamily
MRLDQAKAGCCDLANDEPVLGEATAATRSLDLSAVVAAHGALLQARALWLTKTRSDAADLLQDTWERALRSAPRAIGPDSVPRWLLTIMHNRFLDDRRAQLVRRCVSDGDTYLSQLAADDAAAAPLWRTIDEDRLAASISRLPPAMQDMLRMRGDGASYAVLSLHFQIPVNTVGTRLLRIRARLHKHLREALILDSDDRSTTATARRRLPPRSVRPRSAMAALTSCEIA